MRCSLPPGLRLTVRAARSLRERGVAACFVDDEVSDGVLVTPVADARGEGAELVTALDALTSVVARPIWQARHEPTSQAIQSVQRMRVMPEVSGSVAMQSLRIAVQELAGRVAGVAPVCGLVTDRHPADDLVGHSAAVAALAMRIAHAVGFTLDDVVATGLSASLHDIGLLLVPEEVRRASAAERSPGQHRRWEDHTLLGEALLRPLTADSPSLPVVALQHHEEQGGRVLRSMDAGASRMALVSEVVAVADRYERLVGGAPGEAPLSAASARHTVAAEAGARLNAEVVGRFLDLTPRWAAGTEVMLHGGGYEGTRAVVITPDPSAPDRPKVRAFLTPGGAIDPFDLDLADAPDVGLSAVDQVAA